MFEAGAGVGSVVFEDGYLGDARIQTEFVIAGFVNAEDVGHVGIGHGGHRQGVIGRLDDHVVNPESGHGSLRTMDDALGFRLWR